MKKIFIEASAICFEKMSGIGHTTLEIIKELDARVEAGEQIKVVIVIPNKQAKILNKHKFKNVKIRKFPKGSRYINYIITRTFLPIPVDLWFGRGIYIFPNYKNWYVPFSKSITFVHDVVFKVHPETLNPKNRMYLEDNFNRWLQRTDKLISISKSSAEDLIHYYPKYKNKVSVIYLGVNRDIYYPRSKKEINNVLNTYELPKDYFLYVGNIEPRKNLINLLEAYKIYVDSHQKTTAALVLVSGSGWNSEDIYNRLHELQADGYSIHTPNKYVEDQDLPAIYTQAKALVHVAIHEGFGLPPMQALACQTPVISSNIDALVEILEQYNILFVDPYNIKAISEAFVKVNSHKAPALPKESFTWQKTIENILMLVDTI